MAKVDIQKAYRIVPIHPADRRFLGIRWRDKYFVDLALPFGLRSAPGIFNTVADLLEWILQNQYGVKDLLHYLDDYFTLGPTGEHWPAIVLFARSRKPRGTSACPWPR